MNTLPIPADGIRRTLMPRPFSGERIDGYVPVGVTLADIVDATGLPLVYAPYLRVTINDEVIPALWWGSVRPKAGAHVAIEVVPMGGGGGGGGKNPLRTVLTLAVIVASFALGGPLGTFLGIPETVTLFGSEIAMAKLVGGALISMAGMAVVNAIAPPPMPSMPEMGGYSSTPLSPPNYALTGSRNKFNRYGPVPRVFGKRKVFPVMAARPYTEPQGNDQYMRLLLCPGWGPLDITDISIGNTPITAFNDVEYEVREGWDDDEPITLYTRNINEAPLSVALTHAAGWQTRTTEMETVEIGVDISFNRGLTIFNNSGGRGEQTVEFQVEYSPAGADDWAAVPWLNGADAGFEVAGAVTVTDNNTSPTRRGGRWSVTAGQYDVRIRRVTEDSDDSKVIDSSYFTALRSIKEDAPIIQPGLALIAIRMKATEQLNGVPEEINCIAYSYLQVWNGTGWAWGKSRNPAWAYADMLMRRADEVLIAHGRLDIDTIAAWADACDELGQDGAPMWRFDGVIEGGTLFEGLREIAAHGRASFGMKDGKFSVVRDVPQSVPVQHITPRNSWGYSGEKAFIDQPHALKVRFVNPNIDWQEDERIVYDDGYGESNATVFETIDYMACTSSEQAWREGRYQMASARLRPERHTVSMDIENLRCTLGDLVRLSHDVILVGLFQGRIKGRTETGGTITHITIDEQITMVAGKTYAMRVRKADGTSTVVSIVTEATSTTVVELTMPIAEETAPAVGDLAMFGEAGLESMAAIVKKIEAGPDLTARLTLLEYNAAIHTADTGTIPAFVSKITHAAAPDRGTPADPVIVALYSDETVMERLPNGTLQSRIQIALKPAAPGHDIGLGYEAHYRPNGSRNWTPMPRYPLGTDLYVFPVQDGQVYDVRVRAITQFGMVSGWVIETGHRVEGQTNDPDDVTGFTLNVIDGAAHLSWDPSPNPDWNHYRIKFKDALSGATWESSADKAKRVTTTGKVLSAQIGTYLIKAVDDGGRESKNATAIVSNVAGLTNFNVVDTLTEGSAFAGTHDDTTVIGGALKLDGSQAMADWAALDNVATLYFGDGSGGVQSTGTYTFAGSVDLGARYTSRITTSFTAAGEDLANTLSTWQPMGDVTAMSGASTSDWGAEVQVRHTGDDPSGSSTWTNWEALVIGDYTARAFQFRMVLSTRAATVTPSVTDLDVTVDMPDRGAGANNIIVPNTGLSVTFAPAFKATPAIAVTGENMATGDTFEITNKSPTGFDVIFRNAGGVGVERTMDYVAAGYGIAA